MLKMSDSVACENFLKKLTDTASPQKIDRQPITLFPKRPKKQIVLTGNMKFDLNGSKYLRDDNLEKN